MQPHFTLDLFDFLLDLQANNTREWFQDHKGRYVWVPKIVSWLVRRPVCIR